jgi:uncharacterized protein YdhG (YjbR/CyaY superfamily)
LKPKYRTIDEYIEDSPKDLQVILTKIRQAIRETAPEAEEVISYGMPAFKQNGILVYFAAFKDHIGLFPTASGVAHFKKEFGDYTVSKGTIRFPLNKPIPYDLVKRIVIFRVQEVSQKKNVSQ